MSRKDAIRASDYGSGASSGSRQSHYDGLSIVLHWPTAVLVLTQFALAHTWGFAPKPERHVMIVSHMSLGILLTVLLVVRIVWRALPANRVPSAESGVMEVAAKAVHYLPYVLLIGEAVLGFVLRWSGDEAISFFGLLLAAPFAPFSKAGHHLVGETHDLVGWAIIVLAAFFHHYVLHDGVLMRMVKPKAGGSPYRSSKH